MHIYFVVIAVVELLYHLCHALPWYKGAVLFLRNCAISAPKGATELLQYAGIA